VDLGLGFLLRITKEKFFFSIQKEEAIKIPRRGKRGKWK